MWVQVKSAVFSSILKAGSIIFNNRKSKVIYYHDIHKDSNKPITSMSTPLSLFMLHVSIIRNEGFEIVPEISKEENQVKITFDDGFRGVFENIDVLIESNLIPTIFLVTDFIGRTGFLARSELLEMQKCGVLFQSHTKSHSNLVDLNIDSLKEDLAKSKSMLEDILAVPITDLCFPKGFYSYKVIENAFSLGYLNLYSSLPGYYFETNKDRIIYRNLSQSLSSKDFNSVLYGGATILRKRYIHQHRYE